MSERVAPRPLDAGLGARRSKDPLGEVVRIEQRPDGRGERGLIVAISADDNQACADPPADSLADPDERPIAVER